MKISFGSKGDFKRAESFLLKMSKGDLFRNLDALGQKGVAALAAATPKGETGITSMSWSCEVTIGPKSSSISWSNSNINEDFPVAIMLQYGYGTGGGGWVKGRDYINPAIKPVFDHIANEAWKVVTSA